MSSDEPRSGQSADDDVDGVDATLWETEFEDADLADAVFDPAPANLFTDEIEHVVASDWDVDTALIWGDDVDALDVDEGMGSSGSTGDDFPL